LDLLPSFCLDTFKHAKRLFHALAKL
jgi:hypothetical protein